MKSVCRDFARGNPSDRLRPALLGQAIQPELTQVAAAFVDLQQARHEADYDTARRYTRQEATDLVEQAEQAFADWPTIRNSLQANTFLVGLLSQKNMRV